MGCFSADTSYQLDNATKKSNKAITSRATSALNTPFTPYTGERTAGMTGTQDDVMSQLKSILGIGGTGGSMQLPRLIDNVPGASGGPAGSTQDYMDPFLEQVLGPTLRNINLQQTKNLGANDASATMANAFGDTGHALERAKTMEAGDHAVSDATGQLYSQAYNDALNRKGADIDRMAGDRNSTVNYLSQLFNMGGVEQGTAQAKDDAQFSEFMRKQGYDLDTIAKVSAILGSLNRGTAQTSPSTASSVLGGLSSAAALFM